jgi:glutamate--cysteine ligase
MEPSREAPQRFRAAGCGSSPPTMVPHLLTALKGPLLDLERRFLDATPQIERWLRLEWQEHTPPFYASVDLRNAGFKLAPVDTGLFPAGFENLSESTLPLAVQAAMAAIEKYCPDARNLLLVPDAGSRSPAYLASVQRLAAILRQTGLNVRFGSLDPALGAPLRIELADASTITLEPLRRHGRRVGLVDFDPCSILINDELASGTPTLLADLHEQVLLPPLHAGWGVRRKSQHFAAYRDVARRFAKLLDIDPWLIAPLHAPATQAAFGSREADDALAAAVDALLRQIRGRYREYGIQSAPFVVIKPDAGRSGAAAISVRDAAELRRLGLRERDRLAHGPGQCFLQEGVPTVESVDDAVAEPVVYLIDRYVVGGFYRMHAARATDQALDAPGSQFVPLPFATSCHLPDCDADPDLAQNRFYAYGVVARLATLAAAIELEKTDPDPSLYG